MEGLLDYTFSALGIDGADGGLDRPVLMTETIANLPYSRSSGSIFKSSRMRMLIVLQP